MKRKGCRREVVPQTVRPRRGVVSPEAWRRAYRLAHAESACLERALRSLLAACEPASEPPTPDFLEWVADRLVFKHRANPNVDFVLALRRKAAGLRPAIKAAERALGAE